MTGPDTALTICDLTQSYAPKGGGGISTYLREKRRYVLEQTDHRLLQIVPGPEDRIIENGRHIWVEIAAEPVRGSPNYRFILRTSSVREVLERYRPDLIESQCPWLLPWTAINHRRAHPATALVAGYHTDFPNAHIHRVGSDLFGETIAGGLRRISTRYAAVTYREFDRVYALDAGTRALLGGYGVPHVDVLSLGVDTALFSPAQRDPGLRARLGLAGSGPLLTYAGRIDNEKRAGRLIDMFRQLPPELDAALLMIGDGKLRDTLMQAAAGFPVHFAGFVDDRAQLAAMLASSDIYVSAMADETFGISIVEAQSCGLPVAGVASGAMPTRVPAGLGLLGPVDDAQAMASNVQAIWAGDHQAMSAAARRHAVEQFDWSQTFAALFGKVYPKALWQAAARTRLLRQRQNRSVGGFFRKAG